MIKLLRDLANSLEQMPNEIFEQLLGQSKNPKRKVSQKREKITPAQVASLTRNIAEAKTREEAARILEEANCTRDDLVALSRFNKIHVSKQDNVSDLLSKLVEGLVGSRLNSSAIRGDQI
jgi:hypothetical protein